MVLSAITVKNFGISKGLVQLDIGRMSRLTHEKNIGSR